MREFYERLVGLEVLDYKEDRHVFFRCGNNVLLCFNPSDSRQEISPPPHSASGIFHFAFGVNNSDYRLMKADLEMKGVKVIDEVSWKDGLKSFYFHDPDGNVVEFIPDKGVWED